MRYAPVNCRRSEAQVRLPLHLQGRDVQGMHHQSLGERRHVSCRLENVCWPDAYLIMWSMLENFFDEDKKI